MTYVFPPQPIPSLAVAGTADRLPVHRIYCVGRNYAAHAREMGKDPNREPPFFFMKPGDAVVPDGGAVPYPPATRELHHEVELVAALGRGGRNIPESEALDCVFGYAAGIDLTRRDLQAAAKAAARPWDTAKGFDCSAPCSAVQPAAAIGHPARGRIWLEVNGAVRQDGDLAEMIWSVAETVAALSRLFELKPGDLVFTGTPAGVGALAPEDRARGGVEGVAEIEIALGPAPTLP
jgi:fumarylpyruvate hydrolase